MKATPILAERSESIEAFEANFPETLVRLGNVFELDILEDHRVLHSRQDSLVEVIDRVEQIPNSLGHFQTVFQEELLILYGFGIEPHQILEFPKMIIGFDDKLHDFSANLVDAGDF